jgi:hypothetical protein
MLFFFIHKPNSSFRLIRQMLVTIRETKKNNWVWSLISSVATVGMLRLYHAAQFDNVMHIEHRRRGEKNFFLSCTRYRYVIDSFLPEAALV